MAMTFRDRSRMRKLVYTGLILVVFLGMYVHRVHVMETAAVRNNLLETNLGDVDLGGSAVNYVLVSFRGPLAAMLWWEADELKERHEWDRHKVVVTAIAKLQPHFSGPWNYQGWNLAYNVSVEFDRAEDKYDYISQGVQWLVEGEQKTRRRYWSRDENRTLILGDPTLRDYIGHIVQTKMTYADEADFYRCYFLLSCIPPDRWDPDKLVGGELRTTLLARHPELVRRVRDLKGLAESDDIQIELELQQFMFAHRGLPSRYDWREYHRTSRVQLAPVLSQWPPLPDMDELARFDLTEAKHHNPYGVAYWWYRFSLESLPPPPKPRNQKELEVIKSERRYRLPNKSIMLARSWPALTLTLHAEDLAKIGYFTEGPTSPEPGSSGSSQGKWREALHAWTTFDEQNEIDTRRIEELSKIAAPYLLQFPELAANNTAPPEHRMDDEMRAAFEAHKELERLTAAQKLVRSNYRRKQADVNQSADGIEARKHFYDGKYTYRSDPDLALQAYDRGLAIWKRLLVRTDHHVAAHPANVMGLMANGGGLNGVVGFAAAELVHEFRLPGPERLPPGVPALPMHLLVARTITVPMATAPATIASTLATPTIFSGLPFQLLAFQLPFLAPDDKVPRESPLKAHLDYQWYEYTPLGREAPFQEETWQILDDYWWLRAKRLMPGFMQACCHLSLGVGFVPNCAIMVPNAGNPWFITSGWVENSLESLPLPLRRYLPVDRRSSPDTRIDPKGRPTGPRPGGSILLDDLPEGTAP